MRPHTVPLPSAIREDHRKLFSHLLEVNQSRNVGAILRVAGGWVRDALLGRPSHDIDVAIESADPSRHITGETFAREIVAFQEAAAVAAPGGTSPGKQPTISVIKVNPEKSKHIETAQLTVMGFPLEFCHLRHDAYCDVTRVPTVRPGSPLEDALRRDFTVNALFYNLHTQLVEDYTSGLEDIRKSLLRCPLDPRVTFLDDPLRMLRGIRFSGQLGFRLDDAVLASVDAMLISALEQKVSRERLGIEWLKMMGGPAPGTCWGYMQHMCLEKVVMQELYFAKSKNKTAPMVVERTASLLPFDEEDLQFVQRQWSDLSRLVMPLLVCPQSAAFQDGRDDRVISAMFLLALPSMRSSTSDERAERLMAWSTNGLKLPVAVSAGIRRMLDGFDRLWRNPEAVQLLLRTVTTSSSSGNLSAIANKTWTGERRDAMFDVLMALTDRTVPRTALPVIIAATIVTSALLDARASDACSSTLSSEEVGAMVRNAMNVLESDAGNILSSAQCPLPIRGDEIPSLLQVPSKETGKLLLLARRYCLHQEGDVSRDDVVAFLSHQKSQ